MLNSLTGRMIADSFLFFYRILDALVFRFFLLTVGETITWQIRVLFFFSSIQLLKNLFHWCRELFQNFVDGKRNRSFLFLFCRFCVDRLILCNLPVLSKFSQHLSALVLSVWCFVLDYVSHAYMLERAQRLERLWHVRIFWVCLWYWRSFLVDGLQGASKGRLFLLLLEYGFNLQA